MSDRRDPICGMLGYLEHEGQWFCSQHCVEEFRKRMAGSTPALAQKTISACHAKIIFWWQDPWFWVPLSGLLLSSTQWWGLRLDLPASLSQAGQIYLGYLNKVFVPILLGLFLGGLVDHFVPKEYIAKLLTGSRKRVILRSTLLGFLASTCSHGCLALTIELYRKGASVPAVVSFLLASPWASMSLTLILLSLFGLRGIVIVVASLLIAFFTGVVFQRLARKGWIEGNPHTVSIPQGFSIRKDMLLRWRRYPWTREQLSSDMRGVLAGMLPLGRMVLGWVQLGLILSSVIGAAVPHTIFAQFLGPSTGGLLVTLLVATVMEVCSEGTAPLAFEFYRHTRALGNAFAFLMGGVITDYTELGAVWVNIGRRTVLWMLAVTLPLVLGIGMVLNLWR